MQRLDGIWGPRYTPEERRVRRLVRFRAKIQTVAATLPWQRWYQFGLKGSRFLVTLVVAATLIVGLVHPAVSQGIDLLRLVKPGRYLVAFLNSAELRPAGGFLGSFAIAEFDGKQVTFEVETNIYQHDNAFVTDHFIPLPKPLDTVWTGRSMSLVNANTAADFSESARLMLAYYEAEYGKPLDGVVGLTVLPVIELMALAGPVELPEHDVVITADNFLPVLHQKIQIDYFREPVNRLINEPKTIIADLVALMPERVERLPARIVWKLVERALREKNVMLYFNDSARQQLVEFRNWAGRITPRHHEFLAVYHANYGGGKTSLQITEERKLEKLAPTLRQLTITRSHPGGYDEFTSGENRNYTEVYLPKGTKLLKAQRSGHDMFAEVDARETDVTTFGFWLTTQPHASQVALLEYALPENLKPGLSVIRQPGTRPSQLLVIEGETVAFSGELRYDLELQ